MSFENPSFWEKLDEVLSNFFGRFIYFKYVDSFRLRGNERVLEVGCGAGNLSKFIVRRLSGGGFLTCADSSNYWLSKARERLGKFENIEYLLGDVDELSLKNSSYDVLVLHYVLHDMDVSRRLEILKNLKNKLNGGGRIYIREPTRKSHGMSVNEIKGLMKLSGLKEIHSKESCSLLLRKHYIGVFQKRG